MNRSEAIVERWAIFDSEWVRNGKPTRERGIA